MSRYKTHLLSLFCLSTACGIAFYQYIHDYRIVENVLKGPLLTTLDLTETTLKDSDSQFFQEAPSESDHPHTHTLCVQHKDTLLSLLSSISLAMDDQQAISHLLSARVKKLKIGHIFVVTYQKINDKNTLVKLEYRLGDQGTIVITRNEQGQLFITDAPQNAREQRGHKTIPAPVINTQPTLKRVCGRIESNFYTTAQKQGVPRQIIADASTHLAYVMNFQHGIKRGDSFEILYDEYPATASKPKRIGPIRYIGFMAGNKYHRIYRLDHKGQYFDDKGYSITRGLLQTPIDPQKMRVTSGFGKNRLHPIKGFRRDHKGVDFGAPVGTEIKAAGEGVIVKMGYFGEYGHYVKIRHAHGYETAYGHLSRYQRGLSVGSRVSQNQIIGYVGSTGNATGPHLHFEVIHKGVHVNPMSVQAMPVIKLGGRDLKQFHTVKRNLEVHLVGLTAHDVTIPGKHHTRIS